MKLNENFVIQNIAGTAVVVPVGDEARNFNGMITLNGSAEVIWHELEKGKERAEILEVLKAEYDADEKTLAEDLEYFLSKLKERNILLEE